MAQITIPTWSKERSPTGWALSFHVKCKFAERTWGIELRYSQVRSSQQRPPRRLSSILTGFATAAPKATHQAADADTECLPPTLPHSNRIFTIVIGRLTKSVVLSLVWALRRRVATAGQFQAARLSPTGSRSRARCDCSSSSPPSRR